MNLALVHSRARTGVRAPAVRVEVHLSGGLPRMSIVGLPEAAVREAKDRVRAAITCAQYEFPARVITVNLAPADLPKDGGRFDLPIALGILAASGQIPLAALGEYEFLGELGLTGELRAIDGVLPAALAAAQAGRKLVVPVGNGAEAALASQVEVSTARTLLEVCAMLDGRKALPRAEALPTVRAARRRPGRRARADARAPRAGDRRRRRSPSAADRAARLRQDVAGLAPAGSAAGSERSRSIGNRRDRFGERTRPGSGPLARATVPVAASHRQRGGAGRRRSRTAAGRDIAGTPRRAVSGRTPGVGSPRAGSAARTAGIRRRHHFTRGAAERVSGALPTGRRDEPLPLRLGRRCQRALPVRRGCRTPLPRAYLRPLAGSHRPARRRAAPAAGRTAS